MGWYPRWSYKSWQGIVSSSDMVQVRVIRIRAWGLSHILHWRTALEYVGLFSGGRPGKR